MKISPLKKKWIRRILILLLLRVVIGAIVYYTVVYRFKDIIQLALNIETGGAYEFDAGNIDFQLFKRTLTMNNGRLKFHDKSKKITHHDVEIPKMKLTISSFRELIFQGKVTVINLKVIDPIFSTTSYSKSHNKNISLQARHILKGLSTATQRLHIENFELENGKFSYDAEGTGQPFIGSKIKVSLAGFSEENLSDGKTLGVKDLNISLSNQEWILPDGKHEISFANLRFSARRQHFDLDSFRILVRGDDSSKLVLSAEKLSMNSKDLMNSLEENIISIDSLVCVRPVLDISSFNSYQSGAKKSDTARDFADKFNFNYVNIHEGRIQYNTTTGQPLLSVKTNLKIYNLGIKPDEARKFTTDSIDLNLQGIEFYSKDSLFRLAVGNCVFNGKNVVFKEVNYEPTEKNKSFTGLVYHSPALVLHNVSIDHLLLKQLNADKAELFQPVISMYRGKGRKYRGDSSVNLRRAAMFSNVHKMMQVNEFIIYNGSLSIENEGAKNKLLEVAQINGRFLFNDILESESREEIKSAIDYLKTGTVKINLPGLSIEMEKFKSLGVEEKNYSPHIIIRLKDGSIIEGKNMAWEKLNWDRLIDDKFINTSFLHISKLNLRLVSRQTESENDNRPSTPVKVNIGQLKVDEFDVIKQKSDGLEVLSFHGHALQINKLSKLEKHLEWENISGNFTNFILSDSMQNVSVNKINVALPQIDFSEIAVSRGSEPRTPFIKVPELSINYPVNTSKTDIINIKSIDIFSPQIFYNQEKPTQNQNFRRITNIPAINIDFIRVNKAAIFYKQPAEQDSTKINFVAEAEIKGSKIPAGPFNSFVFAQLVMNNTDFSYHSKKLKATIPKMLFEINNADIKIAGEQSPVLTADMQVNWNDAKIYFEGKNETVLDIPSLTGRFKQKQVVVGVKSPSYHDLLSAVSFTGTGLSYKYGKAGLRAEEFLWNKDESKSLIVHQFEILNKNSIEEWQEISKWQSDYVTLKGKTVSLNDLNIIINKTDTNISVRKIMTSGTDMTITRDKRKPFQHGVEKLMPTTLLKQMPFYITADTIEVDQSTISVTLISEKTNKKAIIPISNLAGTITGANTRPRTDQYLHMKARADILDHHIRFVEYKEFYTDDIDFEMTVQMSSMHLPHFNSIIVPLTAVAVEKGTADTLYAAWKGNKNASYGTMNFHYKNLRLRMLDKKDSAKSNLILKMTTFLANGFVLKKQNESPSLIYMMRDEEKFVVTYWGKSLLSGLMSAAGIRKNKNYKKQFNKNQTKWNLDYISTN